MRSPWSRGHADDLHPPVEMRFIDMFMTALGSLVFLALLLVFLLPKTTQSVTKDQTVRQLQEQNDALQRQIPRQPQPTPSPSIAKTEDRDIVKRMFGVLLLTKGCAIGEPQLYVRWEGTVVSYATDQPQAAPEPFDAANVFAKTQLVGQSYVDISGVAANVFPLLPNMMQSHSINSPDMLDADQKLVMFTGVTRANGSYSAYVGLPDPQQERTSGCAVQPAFLTSEGLTYGDRIVLTAERPYAWLRRFTINLDGTTTLGTPARQDPLFMRDLAGFSASQSQELCTKKSICGTMDAYYALLVPPGPPQSNQFRWTASRYLSAFSYARTEGSSPQRCERACAEQVRCVAVEFSKVNLECSMFDAASPALVAVEDKTDVAIRKLSEPGSSPLQPAAVRDDAFDTYDNHSFAGDDLRSLDHVDQAGCVAACARERACKVFSYDKWESRCHLQASASSLILDPRDVGGVWVGLDAPARSKERIRMEVHPKQRLLGRHPVYHSQATADACAKICAEDDKCVAYSFQGGTCAILDSPLGIYPDEDSTSGFKTQRPP